MDHNLQAPPLVSIYSWQSVKFESILYVNHNTVLNYNPIKIGYRTTKDALRAAVCSASPPPPLSHSCTS